jgi:hypothetical protein
MPRRFIRRAPSADWRTEDVHRLWSNTRRRYFVSAAGPLHRFLQYCALLRRIRKQFDIDDRAFHFDACIFFLRGGYFLFSYLNATTSMWPRAAIFGGLNHGRRPKQRFSKLLTEEKDKARLAGRTTVHLIITDEVKSGTGIGTVLNVAKATMNSWGHAGCDMHISFYAVRQGPRRSEATSFRQTVKKWSGKHKTKSGLLSIEFKHFAGFIPGYDNELLCGIKTMSRSGDNREGYELIRLSDGIVTFQCEVTAQVVFSARIGTNCLVDFLSHCAQQLTLDPKSSLSSTLIRQIGFYGCGTCRELYRKAVGE